MRVVSLLPAATEIVAALGAVGRLVGVSHECDFPPEVRSLPRVTRTRIDPALPSGAIDRAMAEAKRAGVSPVEVDVDLVAHLRPDVLIGQSVCDVCALGEARGARARRRRGGVVRVRHSPSPGGARRGYGRGGADAARAARRVSRRQRVYFPSGTPPRGCG